MACEVQVELIGFIEGDGLAVGNLAVEEARLAGHIMLVTDLFRKMTAWLWDTKDEGKRSHYCRRSYEGLA